MMTHPISGVAHILFGFNLEIGSYFKTCEANSVRLHAHLDKYVKDRKAGITKSQMNGDDLLSAFLQNQDVFSDAQIVDGLIGLILAAIDTTQLSAQSLISVFATRKDITDKFRTEFDTEVRKPALAEDSSLDSLLAAEFIEKVVDFSVAQDLEYLGWCLQETLRINGPTTQSMMYEPTQDVQLGKYHFRKGDMITISTQGVHFNVNEWQRPMELIPERFDHSNPISLTPAGKKRVSASYMAFFGGPRVCFGKTLAEGELKILACYMTQIFDMEFEDPKYQNSLPTMQFQQSHYPEIWLKLKARK